MGLINPTLPVAGAQRSAQELLEISALSTIQGVINGSLDGANLAAGAFAPWRTVGHASLSLYVASSTTEMVAMPNGDILDVASLFTTTSHAPVTFHVPASSPWALAGKTPKLRLVVATRSNDVSPIPNQACPVTGRLRPISSFGGTGGQISYSIGTSVMSATAFGVRAGDNDAASSAIDVPAAGLYVFTATVGIPGQQSGSVIHVDMRVELHHV